MNILIVAQVIPQSYFDVLTASLPQNAVLTVITGSDISGGNIMKCPKHDARSFKSRLICWVKFYYFMRKWTNTNKNLKFDMIFAISNPPINSYIGYKLKTTFNAPFVYMNWDIYPQCIEETFNNFFINKICNVWHSKNNKIFPKIDKIITIGNVMAKTINNSLKQKIDISVIPISTDTDFLYPIEKIKNPFCEKYNLSDKFVVLYSGKMGFGHNIELILDSAVKLEKYQDIMFVFIGHGPKYEVIETLIKEKNSKNILLLPFQPNEIFHYSIACGDIGIVSQEKKMSHLFMPSKTYDMMATGCAIIGICSGDDDLSNLINQKQLGFCVTDDCVETLENAILQLYTNKGKIDVMKQNARNCAVNEYNKSIVTRMYVEVFEDIIGKSEEYESSTNKYNV